MKYKEIEFKYRGEDISLEHFNKFCSARDPHKYIEVSGFDHFYHSNADKDAFCRHRVGPKDNTLTFKRKTSDKNNFVRTERNISLTKAMTQDDISGLCSEFGYTYDSSVFKNCFIYTYDFYTLVFYICYNKEMKELGRFIEIEMSEDYSWSNEQEVWDALVAMERVCRPLGISPQARVKLSLFELFRQDR